MTWFRNRTPRSDWHARRVGRTTSRYSRSITRQDNAWAWRYERAYGRSLFVDLMFVILILGVVMPLMLAAFVKGQNKLDINPAAAADTYATDI